jgi:hypothetical protein
MPQTYRRGARGRPVQNVRRTANYYRPQKQKSNVETLIYNLRKLPRRFIVISGSAVLLLTVLIVSLCVFGGKGSTSSPANGGKNGNGTPAPMATDPTVMLPPRAQALLLPEVTPATVITRDLSFGVESIKFTAEKNINMPSLYGDELFFSAGTGSLDSKIFKNLFVYNLKTGETQKVDAPTITKGEFYQTQINKNWLVWVRTDHGINNSIYVKNRNTDAAPFAVRSTKSGKFKVRLAGNTLIWVEPTSSTSSQLILWDLASGENLPLMTFSDTTYSVSDPCIYEAPEDTGAPGASATPTPTPSPTPTPTPSPTPSASSSPGASASPGFNETGGEETVAANDNITIVWAGPDPNQTPEQKAQEEHSAIFWLKLDQNSVDANGNINKQTYLPGTYVHEPLYNGKYFVWIDNNYMPGGANLYLSEPNGTPKIVDTAVTTYALGDDILVYGKSSKIWVYVISTGEYCCMTGGKEQGKTPCVHGNTVVWFDWDTDEVRFKVLTDEELAVYKGSAGAR